VNSPLDVVTKCQAYMFVITGMVLRGGPIQKSFRPKSSVKWLHRAMFVLFTSLSCIFCSADIEFDFVLM